MKFGLQVSSFTWPGGDAEIGKTLAAVTRRADEVGFDSIWVMDHFFQIPSVGQVEEPMLEGWTALGFMAANSTRARLGLMVGGALYRQPGLWMKAATTLDVLSGGRAWFGIGAGWNEEESRALGFPFPPLRERFELLEDTLRMAHDMWSGEHGSEDRFEGTHVTAERLLNSPQALTRPHIPILIGGMGERKTLRLVAQYGDACNIFGWDPDLVRHKFAVLREHCDALGRPYDEIERTVLYGVDLSTQSTSQLVDTFGRLGEAGAQHIIFGVTNVDRVDQLDTLATEVFPQLR